MSLLGWIFFGLITGFVASRVVNQRGEGCILNIALGQERNDRFFLLTPEFSAISCHQVPICANGA